MHRFFVDTPLVLGTKVEFENAEFINQWKNVFRLETGDSVILFDGSGFDFVCEFTLLRREKAVLSVIASQKNMEVPKWEVHLYCSLIKKDKFEWVLEKGTELGISHFIPVLSDRSEKKNLNRERAQRIITEATEQSGRGIIPVLHPVVLLKESINSFSGRGIVCDIEGLSIAQVPLEKTMSMWVGPEGGWTQDERSIFSEKDIKPYSLGTMTLKSETAALAAAAFLLI